MKVLEERNQGQKKGKNLFFFSLVFGMGKAATLTFYRQIHILVRIEKRYPR